MFRFRGLEQLPRRIDRHWCSEVVEPAHGVALGAGREVRVPHRLVDSGRGALGRPGSVATKIRMIPAEPRAGTEERTVWGRKDGVDRVAREDHGADALSCRSSPSPRLDKRCSLFWGLWYDVAPGDRLLRGVAALSGPARCA